MKRTNLTLREKVALKELKIEVYKRVLSILVKEEKILILAMESQDTKQIARSVKDVLTKCILSKGIKVVEPEQGVFD